MQSDVNVNMDNSNNNARKYRNVYCVNCGEKGHVVKDCDGPITSFGIIAFKMVNSPFDEKLDKNEYLDSLITHEQKSRGTININGLGKALTYPKVKFLMIQRKDTMGYIDFIRGKYPENDEDEKTRMLNVCLHEMIHHEKNNLLTKTFDELWDDLWVNKNSKTYKNEYALAKTKYEKLDIETLVGNSQTRFYFQEFGFPKGRRNMKETNIACAEREFCEETGYTKENYDFIKNYPTIHEEFVGTNGVKYRHIYYLVKMKDDAPSPKINKSDILQTGEVQNIGWFSYDECLSIIRPYDTAKINVIKKVHDDILGMKDNFICSTFYYTSKKSKYIPLEGAYYNYSNSFFKPRSI